MEVRVIIAFLLIHSIRLCYQQDIPVCDLGYDHINGVCVPQFCPNTQVLVDGACRPKPTPPPCGTGFDYINGVCIQKTCPNYYVLINGVCRPNVTYPTPIPTTSAPSVYCPTGYTLYNGMCYHNSIVPSPCQPCGIFNCPSNCIPYTPETTPTPTITTTTTTTTTESPPLEIRSCPPDSVLVDGECRLIYCPKGTAYRGRCLEPVCLDGLVWTGYTCGKPEVITTILEIENTFITEVNQTGPIFRQPEVINNVVYHTETYETSTEEVPCTTTTTTTEAPSASKKCCTIITPRICKRYSGKWVCFNRQYRRCDEVCGNHSVLYLRIPKIIDQPPVLVMPPNPPLQVCADDDCRTSELVDCSGCVKNQREGCSSYCYRYRCPEKRCTFIDQSEYCTKYPGSSGCRSFDGCFQEWCSTD